MKKNKIVAIANGIIGTDPGLSGGDMRFLEIAKHWLVNKQDVQILSSEAAVSILKKNNIKLPLHVIRHDSPSSERLSYIYRTLKVIFQLPKSLSTFKTGIVYSVNDSFFDVISAVKLKLRHPKTVTWVAVTHWVPPFPPWKRKHATIFNSTLFYLNVRASVWLADRFADFILPVSQPTANQLRDIGVKMNKVHPVKCGVNYTVIRSLTKDIPEKKYDAVFMKRIQPVKGVFDLIQIWKKVVSKKKNAKLLVIGDEGNDAVEVKKIIDEYGLSDNIDFAGYIFDFQEKIRKLSQAKVFILPSYEENWGIAIGEAMAAGLPVVAYDLRSIKPIWTTHIEWVPLGNTSNFAQQIVQLLNKPALRRELVEKNYPFISQLEWSKIAQEELDLITSNRP